MEGRKRQGTGKKLCEIGRGEIPLAEGGEGGAGLARTAEWGEKRGPRSTGGEGVKNEAARACSLCVRAEYLSLEVKKEECKEELKAEPVEAPRRKAL